MASRIEILFTFVYLCIYYMDESTKQNIEDIALEAPSQSDAQ